MNFPLLIGVSFAFIVILSNSATAIKCFKCKSEDDCDGYFDFRSDFKEKNDKYIDENCTSLNGNFIPACKYVINKEYAVRERGCGGVGVTSHESFCTNRYKDVIICYCTTDWCNGIDTAGTAINVAKEHFRRQDEQDESENKGKSAAVVNCTSILATLVLSLIMAFNSI